MEVVGRPPWSKKDDETEKLKVRVGKIQLLCFVCAWVAADATRGLNPTKSLCRNGKFCTGQIFVPFLGTKKDDAFYVESVIMLTVSHVNASPTAPSQSK